MKIGIDLGGMSAKIGLCKDGKILRTDKIATGNDTQFEELCRQIAEKISQMTENDSYESVGISSCGLIDSSMGKIVYSNNIPWEDKPFSARIHQYTGKPVAIANDAKCAALAEAVYGAGKGYQRVCLFTLGTGVGGGFIVNCKLPQGSIYADADSAFGHITIKRGGRMCTCGRQGCLEAYASATAVMHSYMERTGISVNAKEIFDGARAGDVAAQETVEEFIGYLAEGVADVVNMLRPQIVVIGGGLSGGADVFLDELSFKVNKMIYGGNFLPVAFAAAKFGNDAGMIGATLLPVM